MSNAFTDLINAAASNAGIPSDILSNLVQVESSGNPYAVSPTGAQGLTQLEPSTAASLGVTNSFDPAQNLNAGATYLAQLYARFKSWTLALYAYNEGPTKLANQISANQPIPQAVQQYATNVLSGTTEAATTGAASQEDPLASIWSSIKANSQIGNPIGQQTAAAAAGGTAANPSALPTGGTGLLTASLFGLSVGRVATGLVGLLVLIIGGLLLVAPAVLGGATRAAKVGKAGEVLGVL